MAYSPFTEAETDEQAPHRQALWKKIKNNDDDHKARADGLDGINASILVDHFEHTDPAIGFTFPIIPPHSSKWVTAVTGAATVRAQSGAHVVNHWLQNNGERARIRGNYRVFPTQLPLIRFRTKVLDWSLTEDIFWGFSTDRAIGTEKGDDMVALHRSLTPLHLKFLVRKNGSETLGTTDITLPTADVWFTIEIRYTAFDTVECRLDGTLHETFATGDPSNVPDTDADNMFPEIHVFKDTSATDLFVSTDRIEVRNTALTDSP